MRIARVIGTVTLNRQHPTLQGGRLKLAVPLSWQDLLGRAGQPVEEVVVYDELGAGQGSLIAVSEGREAAMPFHPEIKPLDAYNAAILDHVCALPPEKLVPLCPEPQTSGERPKT